MKKKKEYMTGRKSMHKEQDINASMGLKKVTNLWAHVSIKASSEALTLTFRLVSFDDGEVW